MFGFKQALPDHSDVKEFDFMFQNDDLYMEFKDQLLPLFRRMMQISLQEYHIQVVKEEQERDEEGSKKAS